MDTLMKKMKENRKMVIIVAVLILVLCASGIYAITRNADTDSTKRAKTTTQSVEKTKKVKQATKEQKDAEKALEEAKKSGDKEAIEKAEKKLIEAKKEFKEVSNSSKSSSSTPSKGGESKPSVTPSKPSEPSTPSTPSKPAKRWIVDKPAWTETVTKYKTETYYVPTWWIKGYNGNIRIYYDKSKWWYDCENGEDVGSWGNGEDEARTKQVPYTETINHPEEGHWE